MGRLGRAFYQALVESPSAESVRQGDHLQRRACSPEPLFTPLQFPSEAPLPYHTPSLARREGLGALLEPQGIVGHLLFSGVSLASGWVDQGEIK